MQVSTKLYMQQSIDRFNEMTADIQKLQTRIATGQNILKASDDPVSAANIAYVKDQKTMLQRFDRNIDRGMIRLGETETALDSAVNIMTRIYELTIQGATDSINVSDRKAISMEISQLRESLFNIANTKDVNGDYLFAGYKTSTKPFEMDEEDKVKYHGDRGVHSVQISDFQRMTTGLSGVDAFQAVDTGEKKESVFSIIEKIVEEHDAGNSASQYIDQINAGLENLTIQQTKVGAQLNKAEQQKLVIENRILLMNENLSNVEDADISKLVSELQSQMLNREAAQRTFAMVGQKSLFDYLR